VAIRAGPGRATGREADRAVSALAGRCSASRASTRRESTSAVGLSPTAHITEALAHKVPVPGAAIRTAVRAGRRGANVELRLGERVRLLCRRLGSSAGEYGNEARGKQRRRCEKGFVHSILLFSTLVCSILLANSHSKGAHSVQMKHSVQMNRLLTCPFC